MIDQPVDNFSAQVSEEGLDWTVFYQSLLPVVTSPEPIAEPPTPAPFGTGLQSREMVNRIGQISAQAGEYLVFGLGQENYGIDLLNVQEIRTYEKVTQLANAPEFFKGILNLRGTIVPILDLRIKFNLGEPRYDHLTVVIILRLECRVVGIVVDGVSDVVRLNVDQIKPPPEMGSSFNADYLMGLGAWNDRMLLLVNIEQLMSSPEMGLNKTLVH